MVKTKQSLGLETILPLREVSKAFKKYNIQKLNYLNNLMERTKKSLGLETILPLRH